MNKKSQMEMMGLVVVVILISLIVLVVLVFMVKEPSSSVAREYYHSQLATNTINAFLRTTSRDCRGHDMTTLIKDCIESCTTYPECTAGDPIRCQNGMNSCLYVADTATEVLEQSLLSLNKKFLLSVFYANDAGVYEDVMEISNSECYGEREASNPQPLSTDRGLMQIQLFLCEG